MLQGAARPVPDFVPISFHEVDSPRVPRGVCRRGALHLDVVVSVDEHVEGARLVKQRQERDRRGDLPDDRLRRAIAPKVTMVAVSRL